MEDELDALVAELESESKGRRRDISPPDKQTKLYKGSSSYCETTDPGYHEKSYEGNNYLLDDDPKDKALSTLLFIVLIGSVFIGMFIYLVYTSSLEDIGVDLSKPPQTQPISRSTIAERPLPTYIKEIELTRRPTSDPNKDAIFFQITIMNPSNQRIYDVVSASMECTNTKEYKQGFSAESITIDGIGPKTEEILPMSSIYNIGSTDTLGVTCTYRAKAGDHSLRPIKQYLTSKTL